MKEINIQIYPKLTAMLSLKGENFNLLKSGFYFSKIYLLKIRYCRFKSFFFLKIIVSEGRKGVYFYIETYGEIFLNELVRDAVTYVEASLGSVNSSLFK